MNFTAHFACFDGCGARYALDDNVYRCQACGALLDVVHDTDALGQRTAVAWTELFEGRRGRAVWPTDSGVWSKREWVLPHVADANVVSFGEGNSPLVRAARYGRSLGLSELWVKSCGNGHTGSFKDLGMTALVSSVQEMLARGRSVRAVACASTGDTSAALAAYCAAAGIPALVLLPRDRVSIAQLVQPLANGAVVLSLDTDFDGCMAVVEALAADGTVYLANSMNSLRIEGQKTVAIEIAQQLGWRCPDWVVVPGGNLGNVYALGKGFELLRTLGVIPKLPRLCVAQSARANPLYRAFLSGWDTYAPIRAEPTLATAIQIGNPVSVHRAVRVLRACDGVVVQATDEQLADAVARADATGFYACPQTGVALSAVEQLAHDGTIAHGDTVVVVSTAHGLKFTEFKRGYHEGTLAGVRSLRANRPVELPADLDAVRRAVDARLGRFS